MKRIFVFIMAFIVFSTNAYSENEMVVSEEEAASLYCFASDELAQNSLTQ